jgi:hypothetical protein
LQFEVKFLTKKKIFVLKIINNEICQNIMAAENISLQSVSLTAA